MPLVRQAKARQTAKKKNSPGLGNRSQVLVKEALTDRRAGGTTTW
jgi:hypothetical protein